MALTQIVIPTGIANGVPIDAANLNGTLVDPMQVNSDAFTEAHVKIPLIPDAGNQPNSDLITSLDVDDVFPGLVFIDLSDPSIVQGSSVTIGLSAAAQGSYLFMPINQDEAPDAQIYIKIPPGTLTNNATDTQTATPGLFRIHGTRATFLAKMTGPDRYLCKDGFHFKAIVEKMELPANVANLTGLLTAQADYDALVSQMATEYLSLVDVPRANRVESYLSDLASRRVNMFEEIYEELRNGDVDSVGSGRGLWPNAKFDTLVDLGSTGSVLADIQVESDCFSLIYIVPPAAQCDSLEFRLRYPATWPDDDEIFERFLISFNVASSRLIPFIVNIQDLTGQTVQFASDGEELIIYRNLSQTSIVVP